ncbi:BACON domain-containing protein [Dysgonomonas termitidis]|uniref:BACON domain-containing protein n=1 Tax=Dysgonomonas termitidis TaxID=1516126 RepID=A0ABV9L408_9BACT
MTAASTGNTFTVKSTAPWTIECFEADGTTSIPNGGWLSVNPATGTATSTATVSVLVAANGGAARTGKLIIQSGLFTHIVTVNQEVMSPTANSFIVAPNTNNYAIPVRNCNMSDLGIQLNDGETFTAEVVWESDANAVSTVTVNGSGPYGNIVVSTGSAEGNGVVCIKKGGVILWSWHIWVTNYNPETGTYVSNGQTFMERNLGAMNNTPGDVGSLGLMYQWGRKDPFPGSASTTANTEPTYATVTKTQAPAGTSPNYNIGVAVANPLTFYTGSSANSYDWYSITASIKNDALWGASKTIYDPCPEGWKVPASGPTSDSPWYDLTSQWFSVGTGADWTLNGRGYYPACGHRGRADGNLTALDTGRGLYGSSAINGNNVKYLDFGPGALNTNSNQARGYASAIRCVVE